MTFEEQVTEALAAVTAGIEDARGDYPDVHEDDIAHEIAASIASQYSGEVGHEVRRRLGF